MKKMSADSDKQVSRRLQLKKAVFIAILLAVFGFMLFLSSKVVLISDDWHFKFIFKDFMPTESESRIESIGDIFRSMNQFYNVSGGRILAHFLLQLVLMADKWIFNIINSVIFVLSAYLIYEITKEKSRYNWKNLAMIFMSIIAFVPAFGDTCIWVSGSVNYLWMSLIYLLFLYCDKKEYNIARMIAAFLSGLTNEPVGGMIVVYFVVKLFISRKKPTKYDVFCVLLSIAGTLFVLMSPGNSSRAEQVNHTSMFALDTAIKCMWQTINWILNSGVWLLLLIPLLLCILFIRRLSEFKNEMALYFSGIAGIFALTLTGTFIVRAEYPCVVFILTSCMGTIIKSACFFSENDLNCRLKKLLDTQVIQNLKKMVSIVVIVLFLVFCGINMKAFLEVAESETQQMDKIVSASKNDEKVQVYLKRYSNPGRFYPEEVSYSNEYEALWRAMYYGIAIEWDV